MKRIMCTVVAVMCATAGAVPVDLMIGSRGPGLGGAYAALAKDASAAYWNPGGLPRVMKPSVMKSNWLFQQVENLNVNYLSLALPVENVGTVSGSWLFQLATLEYGRLERTHTAYENTFSLSVGRRLWRRFWISEKAGLGFSINRHSFSSGNENGAGLGFDLGFLTSLPCGLSIGLVGRNIATDMMGYQIDPEFRLGLGWERVMADIHRVTVGADAASKRHREYSDEATLEPVATNMKVFGGMEYALLIDPDLDWLMAVRGGGNMAYKTTRDAYGYAFGGGIKVLGYTLDYVFMGHLNTDRGLGYQHRITLMTDLSRLHPGQGENTTRAREESGKPEEIDQTDFQPEE